MYSWEATSCAARFSFTRMELTSATEKRFLPMSSDDEEALILPDGDVIEGEAIVDNDALRKEC